MLLLRKDTVQALRTFLRGRTAAVRAFKVPIKTAKMLRGDLADAGIPYINDAGRYADFHSLRHTFITNLARSKVHPKTAQTLARHSSITLTMDRYSHSLVGEQVAAIEALPDLSLPSGQQAVATGTDDLEVNQDSEKRLALCLALRDRKQHILVDDNGQLGVGSRKSKKSVEQAKTASKRNSTHQTRNAPPGIRTPDPLIKSQLLYQLS